MKISPPDKTGKQIPEAAAVTPTPGKVQEAVGIITAANKSEEAEAPVVLKIPEAGILEVGMTLEVLQEVLIRVELLQGQTEFPLMMQKYFMDGKV